MIQGSPSHRWDLDIRVLSLVVFTLALSGFPTSFFSSLWVSTATIEDSEKIVPIRAISHDNILGPTYYPWFKLSSYFSSLILSRPRRAVEQMSGLRACRGSDKYKLKQLNKHRQTSTSWIPPWSKEPQAKDPLLELLLRIQLGYYCRKKSVIWVACPRLAPC